MKIKVLLLDGPKLFEYNGKYDEANHTVQVKRKVGLLTRENRVFLVDVNHIKFLPKRNKLESCVIVDNRTMKSIPIGEGDPPFDKELENTLSYLIDKAKWEARRSRQTIKGFTIFTLMLAGYGIVRFIEWIIFALIGAH